MVATDEEEEFTVAAALFVPVVVLDEIPEKEKIRNKGCTEDEVDGCSFPCGVERAGRISGSAGVRRLAGLSSPPPVLDVL